jgi:predicted lipopolysaccharide heptosyltransferase III
MQTIEWSKEHVKRILVIKMRYIGDTVLATPLLHALKASMPAAETHFLLNEETASIIKGHSKVDHLVPFDLPRAKKDVRYFIGFAWKIRRLMCDMVIDLSHNDRSALFTFLTGAPLRIGYDKISFVNRRAYTHLVPYRFGEIHTVDHHLMMAEHLGVPLVDTNPDLPVFPKETQEVRDRLESAGVDNSLPYILIHPGARRWYKSWPVDRFAHIGDLIGRHHRIQVVLSGGPSDQAACDAIASRMTARPVNLCGQIALPHLPALIAQSELLIGNDSAPIHIATAVNTPVIALFGPTRWENWYPRREHDVILTSVYPCRPCGHSKLDCPLGDTFCMSAISMESVWESVRKQLSRFRIE